MIKEVENIYIDLEKLLPEYTFVGSLEEDSANILELVKQGYENIVRTVSFDVSEDDDLEFELYSNCGRENSSFYETSKCTDVTYGNTYKFRMEIKYKEYRRKKNAKFMVNQDL